MRLAPSLRCLLAGLRRSLSSNRDSQIINGFPECPQRQEQAVWSGSRWWEGTSLRMPTVFDLNSLCPNHLSRDESCTRSFIRGHPHRIWRTSQPCENNVSGDHKRAPMNYRHDVRTITAPSLTVITWSVALLSLSVLIDYLIIYIYHDVIASRTTEDVLCPETVGKKERTARCSIWFETDGWLWQLACKSPNALRCFPTSKDLAMPALVAGECAEERHDLLQTFMRRECIGHQRNRQNFRFDVRFLTCNAHSLTSFYPISQGMRYEVGPNALDTLPFPDIKR